MIYLKMEVQPMAKQYSIAEAKNKLPSIIHQVEKGPSVELTRRGKPVVVLLSISEFERLNISNSGFWDSLMSFRKMITSDQLAFSDQNFEDLRDPSCGREVKWDG
jgi:antitoxin Phd